MFISHASKKESFDKDRWFKHPSQWNQKNKTEEKEKKTDTKLVSAGHKKMLAQRQSIEAIQIERLLVDLFVMQYAIKNIGIYDWLVPKKFLQSNFDKLTEIEKFKYRNELIIKHNKLIDDIHKLAPKITNKNRMKEIIKQAVDTAALQCAENLALYYEDKDFEYNSQSPAINDDDAKD